MITDLGFSPTVSVVFRLDKQGEIADQQDDMIRLISGVLDRVPGDAVLHKDLEQIWLLRRGGDLSVSEQDDLWPPGAWQCYPSTTTGPRTPSASSEQLEAEWTQAQIL